MFPRNKLPLLLALALAVLPLQAQNFLFKVGGGVAGHWSDSRPVPSFMGGAAYEYEFSERWGVSPGLFLQQKGWKHPDADVTYFDDPIEGDPAKGYRTGKMGRKTSLLYLTVAVPFNYYLRVDEGRYVILSAGPFASCGLTARRDIQGDPSRTEGDRISYTERGFSMPSGGLHRFDAGLQAQVAFQFANGFTVGLQGDFSMLNSLREGAARNVAGLLTLSYNFHQGNSYRQRQLDAMWQEQ